MTFAEFEAKNSGTTRGIFIAEFDNPTFVAGSQLIVPYSREEQSDSNDDAQLPGDRLLNLLSVWNAREMQPRRITEYLWQFQRLVSWDALPREAFRGDCTPTDEAIAKALKRIKAKLGKVFDRFQVDLEIIEKERRVRLLKH